MKAYFLLFLMILSALGCQNNSSISTDPQQNRYYRIYNEIYNDWSKIPIDSTRQQLDTYLREFPENADAQMMAGNVAFSLAEDEKAIDYYRNAISIQTNRSIFYSALGNIYCIQNRIDSAEKYLTKAFAMHDSSAYTYMIASMLYLKKNEKERCLALADSAFKRGNSMPAICSGLSFIFFRLQLEGKSKELFDRAVLLGLKDTSSFKETLVGKLKLEDYYRKNYTR